MDLALPVQTLVPFGARPRDGGVQFTVFSRHATRCWLLLFDGPNAAAPATEHEFDPRRDRLGDVWSLFVPGIRPGARYAYRMEGPRERGVGHCFNPEQWLIDPWALAVDPGRAWGDTADLPEGKPPVSGQTFPKSVVVADDFDWGDDQRPRRSLAETVIYEAHLRGFTRHPSSGAAAPGTYRGFMEKIPYLRDLGVTAVEFLPLQQFNELEYYVSPGPTRRHLRNYWGYSTTAFFAPNGAYAAAHDGSQVREFKELVRALHQAGIEVVLDVVFNHTGEGDETGPTSSFRGIDNRIFYHVDDTERRYRNYSGCGNALNANHPVVREFILSCLRYWAVHFRVDGFRFDLATILTRGEDGEPTRRPPLVEAIAQDPVLRDCKLIAEAWDAAGGYQVGAFPGGRFSEWNDRFRDDVRRFWRGDPDSLHGLMTRLVGSPELYGDHPLGHLASVNYVACHDGLTLNDLVTYERKHNEANGENNRDGHNHEFSCNHGVEGPSDDPEILAARRRHQRNCLMTLLLAPGVPMLLAGDECSRTQLGNNNAYCQDSELSWFDWSLPTENADLLEFTRELIALRRALPRLGSPRLAHSDGGHPRWQERSLVLGFESVAVLVNGESFPVAFTLPAGAWRRTFSTDGPGDNRVVSAPELPPRTIVVLTS